MNEYYINLIILAIGAYYIYKAIRQIIRKEVDMYNNETFTKESLEKWAVVDGWLKVAAGVAICAYAVLALYGIKILWALIVAIVGILALYFVYYKKTLEKKPKF